MCLEARIGAVKNLKLLTFLPFTAARTRKIMVFVWAAREQVLASRSCSPATGKEMARAHNALATYEVTREVGDGVEFAGENAPVRRRARSARSTLQS